MKNMKILKERKNTQYFQLHVLHALHGSEKKLRFAFGWECFYKEYTMHIYWRILQDLNSIGEFLIFRDPSLNRSFRHWMKKNAGGLAYAEDWGIDMNSKQNLN